MMGEPEDGLLEYSDFEYRQLKLAEQKKATRACVKNQRLEVAGDASSLATFPRTELGNAERLVFRCGSGIRYCSQHGAWFVYDGVRWAIDRVGQVERHAKETIRETLSVAAQITDSKERDGLWKHCRDSEKRARLESMIALARSENGIPIGPDDLDADPWLLNVANGTVDLRTGRLRPHSRADLITKLAPVKFDPAAACPRWLQFQERVTGGDPDLIELKRRALGYALTGVVSDKRTLYMLHGDSGNNGKTTEVEVFREMLGSYGGSIRIEALMEQARSQGNAPSPDIADLCGLRLVVCSEPSEGQRLSEATIKYLTGMGTIKARHLNKGNFEFKQTFKFFMECNHKPVIRGTDNAIWNRIGVIPFNVMISDEEIDRDMPAKLREELPGILNWAIAGCLAWQRSGLNTPKSAAAATAEYRSEMDGIGRFIEERCVLIPNASARGKNLYTEYLKWGDETGEKPVSNASFGRQLSTRGGISKTHDDKGVKYEGIGIRTE